MMRGETIAGRFQIEEQIGEGGAGTVFRARDLPTGDAVAVKILRRSDVAEGVRFAREADVLSQLRHPGLVRYILHGVISTGEPYLAMEWLEGEDLSRRLKHGELLIGESLALARRAAEVLAVVHGAGLLHRDLKPGNLFLCGGDVDRLKLIDFGLARRVAATAFTQTGMVVGTPAYMSPEQARGARDIDERSDLFSLGCVLYRCLTGHAPFGGAHAVEVMTKVLLHDPTPIRELSRGVPDALAKLVHALLAKSPDRRPRSASAVLSALAEIEAPPDENGANAGPAPVSMRGITADERRMVSVLLVAGDDGAALDEAGGPQLEAAVLDHDGTLAALADGTRVVLLQGSATPTEQADRAARCALSLRAVLPRTPMALATGTAELSRRAPIGGAIERAAALLASMGAHGPDEMPSRRAPRAFVALDAETAALVDARFDVREVSVGLGLFGVRALELGARTLLGKATTLVGRDRELSAIGQLFRESVDAPAAAAVLVTAAAGMGKSRLAHELIGVFRAVAPDVEVWIGRSEAARSRSALGLLGAILRSAAGLREGEPPEEQRAKLEQRIRRNAPAASVARWTEMLSELVGAGPAEPSPALRAARADPQVMSEQVSRAWEGFLGAETAGAPVVIVVEDLQWADPSTVRFIDAALAVLDQRPWMVLGLARPEVHQIFPDLWQRRSVQTFRLSPLNQRASVALVRQVLGDSVDQPTAERIATQSAGNAFHLEELIRAVAQGRATPEADLPETVLAMVQARLAGLEPEPRRILRAASIFGASFAPGGLAALLGGSVSWSLSPWLDALTAQEILVRRPESRFEGEAELAFRHALLREGAYAMLTEDDRALGHELAGEWLEQHGERDPAVLAEHFEKGKNLARAGVHYERAARRALRSSDTDAAMALARRGLDCDVDEALQVSLLDLLCEAHAWRDEWTRAVEYGERAIALAWPGSAPWASGMRARLGEALRQNDLRRLLSAVEQIEAAMPSPEAAGAVLLALSTASFILIWSCRFEEASLRLQRMARIVFAVAPDNPVARGWLHVTHAISHALVTGTPWLGVEHAEEALACFQVANHTRGALLARFAMGGNAWAIGALELAHQELAATLVAEEEFALASSLRAVFLSNVLADLGRFDEARKVPVRLIERARARGSLRYEGQARVALAGVLFRAGEPGPALAEVTAALRMPLLMPLDRMHGTALSAAILLGLGRAAEALHAAEQALALHRAHGGLGGRRAFARLVHAEALFANGRIERAHDAIRSAAEAVIDRAGGIADADLLRCFLERVPENARTLQRAAEWLG